MTEYEIKYKIAVNFAQGLPVIKQSKSSYLSKHIQDGRGGSEHLLLSCILRLKQKSSYN